MNVNGKQDSVGEKLKIMTPMTKYGRRQSTINRDGLVCSAWLVDLTGDSQPIRLGVRNL